MRLHLGLEALPSSKGLALVAGFREEVQAQGLVQLNVEMFHTFCHALGQSKFLGSPCFARHDHLS
jgi:hypothetical protein